MHTLWHPADYERVRGVRLRPLLDLLAQVPPLPPSGGIADLGCGSGVAGGALSTRFGARDLHGVDGSAALLEEAEATGHYTSLESIAVADWQPHAPMALVLSNGALTRLNDLPRRLPQLAEALVPGGVLAVQIPVQHTAPAHGLIREICGTLFPDRADWAAFWEESLDFTECARILDGLGRAMFWDTTYGQMLAPVAEGHPVRHVTQSTVLRRVLDQLSPCEAAAFLSTYDAALDKAYPTLDGGKVLYGLRRAFFVLQRPTASL